MKFDTELLYWYMMGLGIVIFAFVGIVAICKLLIMVWFPLVWLVLLGTILICTAAILEGKGIFKLP